MGCAPGTAVAGAPWAVGPVQSPLPRILACGVLALPLLLRVHSLNLRVVPACVGASPRRGAGFGVSQPCAPAESPESARPDASPCVRSLLQLVISGPVQQSPHAALPPGFYPHIHTPPLGYGAVPAHPAAHPALPTHPGHTFISGVTFPFRPIR